MRTWLVTGGAGFIGSHLVDALLGCGDRVRVLDDLSSGRRHNLPAGAELLRGSVTDAPLVRRATLGASGVFHLAAIASVARCTEEWVITHAVNQSGTVTVLDAAHRAGNLPVVFASSAAVYGDLDRAALTEADPCDPGSAYGCDKLGSEIHARMARRTFGVPTLGLRFFNIYGPRQDGSSPYSGVISLFRRLLSTGEILTLNGDGRQTRDFVYVADVVAAMIAGMARLRESPDALPPVLNVCTGAPTTVRDLALLLCDLAGVTPRFRYAPAKAGDIVHSCGDPTLMARELGARCATDIREGLERTARQDPARPDWARDTRRTGSLSA